MLVVIEGFGGQKELSGKEAQVVAVRSWTAFREMINSKEIVVVQ